MSTFVELLDECAARISEQNLGRVRPLLNRTLMTLCKRLIYNKSDLARGDLAVSLYAEDNYTANTIAFVDGGEGVADTITDSANGFVSAGFVAGMYITTDQASNTGTYKIATAAAGTLTLVTTDSLTAAGAGSDVVITSVDDYGDLPADFIGLVDKPYINGKTWQLEPLPSIATKLSYTAAGESKYYEVIGNKFWVYPATSSDITINGPYWQKPAAITTFESTLPYSGIFDDVIIEVLVRYLGEGAVLNAQTFQEMEAFLFKAVDYVCSGRPMSAANEMPTGINWDFYLEG